MIRQPFEELKASGQLPSPAGVGMRILKLTQTEDYSAEDLARTIMSDSALTGRLIKIANSAQSGGVRPVTTVAEATMRIGVRAVKNVALGLSLVSANRSGTCARFNYDSYWSMCLARAVAAQTICRQLRVGVPAEAYILGLLSEVGTLALASVYPEPYGELLDASCGRRGAEMAALERKRFEIDHSEVSSYMLRDWGLPEQFSQAVQLYESPSTSTAGLSREAAGMVRVLRFAEVFAGYCTCDPNRDRTQFGRYSMGLEELRVAFGMSREDFVSFCGTITREWGEWGRVLQVPTQSVISLDELDTNAQREAEAPLEQRLTPVADLLSSKGPCQDESEMNRRTAEQPAHGPSAMTHALVTAAELANPSRLKILAVDDDAMSLKLLERALRKSGHEIRTAADGAAALQIALDWTPNVVVADWLMPELDGLELCKTLRRIEVGRSMYFFLLTGRTEEDRIVEAFDAGVDDYVVKPLNARVLLARIKGGQRVIELQRKVEEDKRTMLRQVAELGLMTRKLNRAAYTDVLTELPNRRHAMQRLDEEWANSSAAGKLLSVIMLDIDHFKKVNDTYGHDIGDVVLKETAKVLRAVARQNEDAMRLGGEEFFVILPNTDEDAAAICAERMRAAVDANHIEVPGYAGHVTVSLGVAQRLPWMTRHDELIKAADEAVYVAKHAGRNQCRLASRRVKPAKSA